MHVSDIGQDAYVGYGFHQRIPHSIYTDINIIIVLTIFIANTNIISEQLLVSLFRYWLSISIIPISLPRLSVVRTIIFASA